MEIHFKVRKSQNLANYFSLEKTGGLFSLFAHREGQEPARLTGMDRDDLQDLLAVISEAESRMQDWDEMKEKHSDKVFP